MNKFRHCLLWIWGILDVKENLFDSTSKYEDCECDSAYVKYRSVRVFDKSSDEEMLEDVRWIFRSDETNK